MTKTIKGQTSHYFLTIHDATGMATDCTCKDRFYRQHFCKHMTGFNRELDKAIIFQSLMNRFDMRSQAVREARYINYINFEMSMGL